MDGYSYSKAFEGITKGIVAVFWIAGISFPLALWKLIDIVWWICSHVSLNFK